MKLKLFIQNLLREICVREVIGVSNTNHLPNLSLKFAVQISQSRTESFKFQIGTQTFYPKSLPWDFRAKSNWSFQCKSRPKQSGEFAAQISQSRTESFKVSNWNSNFLSKSLSWDFCAKSTWSFQYKSCPKLKWGVCGAKFII